MMFNELKIYLPKFLSAESEKNLYDEIRGFINNSLKNRYYTSNLSNQSIVFQGDGIFDLPFYNNSDGLVKSVNCMVISNTCDIDISNKRSLPTHISYCPIIMLSKYKDILIKNSSKTQEQIDDHISAIRRQEVTQMFYLPKNNKLKERVNSTFG